MLEVLTQSCRFIAQIDHFDSGKAQLTLLEELPLGALAIGALIVGMPKGQVSKEIVESCAPFGIGTIIFFHAERSQGKINYRSKQNRLQKVAEAVSVQSGAPLPTVELCSELGEALKKVPRGGFLLSPAANQSLLTKALKPTQHANITQNTSSLALNHDPIRADSNRFMLELPGHLADCTCIIGPEGGLSTAEEATAREFGFTPVRIGPYVLRTELAALTVCSLLAQFRDA